MIRFNNWFFNKLPPYFKRNDTYKDNSDEGLLERYLKIFGLELDQNFIPQADGFISETALDTNVKSIVDPLRCDEKYLVGLAFSLGNPPDLLGDPATYRKLLSYIVSVYKIKGTKTGYKLFFALLGYNVNIVEYWNIEYTYDAGFHYDEGVHYDNACQTCSDYEIVFSQYGLDCTVPQVNILGQSIIDLLMNVVHFMEPINANLIGFINKAKICESFEACTSQDIGVELRAYAHYDAGLHYDDGKHYDAYTVITTSNTHLDCVPSPGFLLLADESGYIVQGDDSKIIIS